MRRLAVILGTVAAVLAVSTPAYAFAHDRVHNTYLHAVLDVLTLAVVSAPLWTAYLWGGRRRGLLLALVAVVQVPVAVIGFVPIVNPLLHLGALLTALALTGFSLGYARRSARTAPVPRSRPASS
ncbi:MAG TPA: hypothetical protein VFE14_15540 [Micromonosporaceae bacterium]|jgi:hypothetical protein|nr:hypothetical protein [Micromonosporaceae bacterium]